jgi:hypothetical protein
MDFTEPEKQKVFELTSKGWPVNMAEVAIAAQKAGHDKAIDYTAEMVKLLTVQKTAQETDALEAKKSMHAQLQELENDRSFGSVQKRISLKNAIAKLG